MLSCDLKWNLHINKVCCKAICVFHMIKRSVSNLGQKAKLDLYKSMIVPILTYASPCYGLSKYIITELENVQRRIVKWIIPHIDSYKDRLIEISLLPLPIYIQINNLLLLSKILSKKLRCRHVERSIVFLFLARLYVSAREAEKEIFGGRILLPNMSASECDQN